MTFTIRTEAPGPGNQNREFTNFSLAFLRWRVLLTRDEDRTAYDDLNHLSPPPATVPGVRATYASDSRSPIGRIPEPHRQNNTSSVEGPRPPCAGPSWVVPRRSR